MLAFSIDYYGIFFRATQSVELFCTYKQDTIEDILGIIIPETRDMFACEMIATKAVSIAQERIQALEHMGFCLSEEALIGHDGTKYNSYYVREV